jgi:hypothetical protein
MWRWSSEIKLLALAFVALSCSDSGVHAFALCDGCPDLFANASNAQQTAQSHLRAQSARLHDQSVNHRRSHRRNEPLPPALARRTALTAFAAETAAATPPQIETDAKDASVSVAIDSPALSVADAATAATPAFHIDALFNLMAAGPSDQPEEVAAIRASILTQVIMRPSPKPNDRSAFLAPMLIVFAGGLLVGAVLISARRRAFALRRKRAERRRPLLRADRDRRLTRRINGLPFDVPTLSAVAAGERMNQTRRWISLQHR